MANDLYFGGIPTRPDVDALIEHLGVPDEGNHIMYADIEKVIGVTRYSNRGNTVIAAWRKRLFNDHNVVLIPNRGKSFKAANPHERVDVSRTKVQTGYRSIRRGSRIARKTDMHRLDEPNRKACEHLAQIDAMLSLAERTRAKELKD